MQQKKILINTLVIVLVVGALAAAYFYFFSPTGEDEEIGLSTATDSAAALPEGVSASTSEFLILLESLQSVDLNGQIFKNRIFASELENFTTPIAARPKGRSNPFSALGTNNL